MPFTASFLIGSALVGGYKLIKGMNQKSEGERIAAGNRRPTYNIPQAYFNNQSLMENQAQSGLGAPTLDYTRRTNDRGLSSGIDAILQGGGSVNSLSKLYDVYGQNNSAIAAQDSQLRTQHLNSLIEANKDLAGQQVQKWAIDEYEPYKDKAKQAAKLIGAGDANEAGAVDAFGSAIGGLSKAKNYSSMTTSKTPTFGERDGIDNIEPMTSSLPEYTTTSTFPTQSQNSFDTQGGNDTIARMAHENPNSPYIKSLLQYINRPK